MMDDECWMIRAYETIYFGRTAEERLLDMATRAKLGPAEGEPGVTRVESSTSNGVQVSENAFFFLRFVVEVWLRVLSLYLELQ